MGSVYGLVSWLWGLQVNTIIVAAEPPGSGPQLLGLACRDLLLTCHNFNHSIDNHMPSEVCDEITFPFPNLNGLDK